MKPETPVAVLWELDWDDTRLSCAVYRHQNGFQLRVTSPTAIIVAEQFALVAASAGAGARAARRTGPARLADALTQQAVAKSRWPARHGDLATEAQRKPSEPLGVYGL